MICDKDLDLRAHKVREGDEGVVGDMRQQGSGLFQMLFTIVNVCVFTPSSLHIIGLLTLLHACLPG